MITYNDIYESLRRERYSEQLQKLPSNFISEIISYFDEKKEIANKEEDLFSDSLIKTKKQLENAISIFKELVLRRKKKLINLSFIAAETGISKKDFENMLNFEKTLFDKLVSSLNESNKELNGLMKNNKEKKRDYKMLVFKEDVTEFIGLDGEKQGPFKKGDIVNLPKEIADILLADNKVEVVDEG